MTDSFRKLAVPGVCDLQPYQPGKPIKELEREYGVSNIIKLASNENPLGPGEKVIKAIERASRDISLYPDANSFDLKQHLAAKHAVDMSQITLGNGSNEVLVLLAETFLKTGDEAIYSQYAFQVYPIAIGLSGATPKVAPANAASHAQPLGHDLAVMESLITDDTRMVFIANPNNPTGTWLKRDALLAFLQRVPDHALVVVDEAYIDYVVEPEYPDCSEWLDEFPNLVVCRTFSKAYALAGIRVGYSLSHPDVADLLNRVRQPFNVNLLAQVAAIAALEDTGHLKRSVEINNSERDRLAKACDDLGIQFVPSVCNFFLIDLQQPAMPVYEALLREGIIVRPVANYGLPDCLRITIGTPDQNGRLITALSKVLAIG